MNPFEEYLAGYRQEGIRYLREHSPEVGRLESLSDFEDLRFVKGQDLDAVLVLQYETRAPSLFPSVRQRLIDKGVGKRHNILHTYIRNEGTPDEVYNVTMGFYGSRLQISLDVRR